MASTVAAARLSYSVCFPSTSSTCSSAARTRFPTFRPGLSLKQNSVACTTSPISSIRNESSAVTQATVDAGTEESVGEKPAPNDVTKIKLESELLKKKAKRAELRRKRLLRKRRMRKKGRWPPSKMAKLKHV